MDSVINRFISILKHNGVSISPSETIDALRGLAYVGMADRETVRAVLGSTLIKDTRDIPVFDELFDIFFSLPGRMREYNAHPDRPAQPTDRPFELEQQDAAERGTPPDDTEREDVRLDTERLAAFSPAPDPDSLDVPTLSHYLVLNQHRALLDEALQQVYHLHVKQAGCHTRPGSLSPVRATEEIDLQVSGGALNALLDDLRDLGVDEEVINELAQRLHAQKHDLTGLLRRYLAREVALLRRPVPPLDPAHPVCAFTAAERHQMEELIRRLGRQMRGALSYRRAIDQRGRMHVARTVRNSLKYDGIPFYPVLARRRDERPRLIVICDVSLSVRHTARFMLHLLYSLQSFFERVRSFVFVSDLVEVSTHFEQIDIEAAINMVFGGTLIDCDASSNYGRALDMFYTQHLAAVTRRSTVIILGDGRGNGNPPNAWILEEIRRRAKQVIWLTPEARGSWQLAGSDMPVYAPICQRVEVVRNLDQLGKVTEDLFRWTVHA